MKEILKIINEMKVIRVGELNKESKPPTWVILNCIDKDELIKLIEGKK